MTGKELALETYKGLLQAEPDEAMATHVVASLAALSAEELAQFVVELVNTTRAPEMPHEDSGLKMDEKMRRLKTLNILMNKLPAFESALKRLHEQLAKSPG